MVAELRFDASPAPAAAGAALDLRAVSHQFELKTETLPVTVSDATGQEVFHTFKIAVKEKADPAPKPPEAKDPEPKKPPEPDPAVEIKPAPVAPAPVGAAKYFVDC